MTVTRIAGPEDVEALVWLRRSLMLHFGWDAADQSREPEWISALRRRVASGISQGTLIAVVCEVDGETVAGGIAEIMPRLPSPSLPKGHIAHVSSMYTVPAFRGNGLGRSVVQLLTSELERRGFSTIELYAASPEAEALYRSESFTDRPGGRPMRYAPDGGPSARAT